MRIQVVRDSSASVLTVHAEGYNPAIPPARLAATLASAIEAALTEPAPPAQPSPTDQQPRPSIDPPVDQAPVDTATPVAVVAAPDVAAPDVAAGDSGPDGPLRRTALTLLDSGLTDDQVCAQLGISQPRLLRFDDPRSKFLPPSADEHAAVTA